MRCGSRSSWLSQNDAACSSRAPSGASEYPRPGRPVRAEPEDRGEIAGWTSTADARMGPLHLQNQPAPPHPGTKHIDFRCIAIPDDLCRIEGLGRLAETA